MSENNVHRGENRQFDEDEKRSSSSRRMRPDQRKGIRFDTAGGDRRSGFARRQDDDGLRNTDFED